MPLNRLFRDVGHRQLGDSPQLMPVDLGVVRDRCGLTETRQSIQVGAGNIDSDGIECRELTFHSTALSRE